MNGDCPHCGANVLVFKGLRAKVRTSILVIHKSGGVETNCPSCRKSIILPLRMDTDEIRKGSTPQFGVPLDTVRKPPA